MSIRIGSANQYDTRATVFKPEVKASNGGKTYVTANLSTSKKLQTPVDGKEYVNSNWFATFVGKAAEKATKLVEKDRIELTFAEIENQYNKDTDKNYIKVVVYDFNMVDANATTSAPETAPAPAPADDGFMSIPDGIDETLPFN